MQSCYDHGACGVMCLDIGCDSVGPPYDNIEPRLQLGVPPLLVLDLGTCGCASASVDVSCTPNAYSGTAAVTCGPSSSATVDFSTALPDQSCCTLTFSGDIQDTRTIVMLMGDVGVERNGVVSISDAGQILCCLGQSPLDWGARRDVNRDCGITPSDHSSVKARLWTEGPVPCECP